MKYILLVFCIAVLSCSCVDLPQSNELSDEEIKSKAEVEEIEFEIEEKLEDDQLNNSLNTRESMKTETINRSSSLGKMKDEVPRVELPKGPIICRGPIEPTEDKPYNYVSPDFFAEIDPQYPGGIAEMKKFIQANIRYPYSDISVQGRVYITMIIDTNGRVTDPRVVRGVSAECDQEALRLVRSMPNWIPAQDGGKVVAARVRLPITFDLH